MRLADCLNYADIRTLQAIANHYDFSCTKHSKMSLHQAIVYNFRRASFLSEQISNWARGREKTWLRIIIEPHRPYALEEISGWFADGKDVERAKEEGWLFPAFRFPDRRMQFYIPEELHAAIRRYATEYIRSQLKFSQEGPLIYADEQQYAHQDLDAFLEYIQNHEVSLTQDGTMYKRHLQAVMEIMRVPEELLRGGWRFGYGRRFHDYPDRFALLYDFAFAKGYVAESCDDRNELKITEKCKQWIEADYNMRIQWLVQYYLSSYRRAILRLPIVLRLLALTKQQWVEENSMFQTLCPFLQEYYYDSVADVWNQRILKMLLHLGLIRRGEDESGVRWFQTTNIGQQLLATGEIPAVVSETSEQKVLIVQPNFNVLVTAHQPTLTAELAHIAKLWETGAMQVYRLSEESFCQGLSAEKTGLDWIRFLHSHAQAAIPGNVEKTLLDWVRGWQKHQDSLTS